MARSKSGSAPVDVFLCECGPIIKEGLDIEGLAERLSGVSGVRSVEIYPTLCSEEGRQFLATKLRRRRKRRVVIAACSPREHEVTFRNVCEQAGINPYLMAMANVREQCSWVTKDREAATDKAEALTRSAIARCQALEPLAGRQIDVVTDALVVGAGVSGLTAARLLARAGRRVFLVEHSPAIGGTVARLSDVFPKLECASCMLEPLMDEVLHTPKIEVLTYTEVDEVVGSYGNFTVRLRKKARRVDPEACYGCKTCQSVCPVEMPNEFEEGLSGRKAVHVPYAGALPNVSVIDESGCLHFRDDACRACADACPFGAIRLDEVDELIEIEVGGIIVATGAELQQKKEEGSAYELPQVFSTMALERMLNESGCTEGAIRLRDGKSPQSVALVHCADDLGGGPVEPCSKICCMTLARQAKLLRNKLPDARIVALQWDRCLGGKGFRELVDEIRVEAGVEEIRLGPSERIKVLAPSDDGAPARVRVRGNGGKNDELEADMVVMSPPLVGAGSATHLAETLRLDRDTRGFFVTDHDRLRSYASRLEGIYIAGCSQGPKDIEEAASHGAAAAGELLSALIPGRKLMIDPARAAVDPERCAGCGVCLTVCPYKAISFDVPKRVAAVNDLLCRGCGTCASACPSNAVSARHATDRQILAEVKALVS